MAVALDTPDNLKYKFYPVSGAVFTFKVRSPNDAHLALSPTGEEGDPMYEVFLGGWSNSKSVIRKNRQMPDVAEADTLNILSSEEFRGFWVRWYDNVITVGREGEAVAFMSYEDFELLSIKYVGVCTGWGASGSWLLDIESDGKNSMEVSDPDMSFTALPSDEGSALYEWVSASQGEVPTNAVQGGFDGSDPLYVARARHEDDLVPGKLHSTHGVCYIAWGGNEHSYNKYDVLCGGNGEWISVDNGVLPTNAVPGGMTADGETLFVGRAMHEGTITIGKVQPSHECCYISYGGREFGYRKYEVLVASDKDALMLQQLKSD